MQKSIVTSEIEYDELKSKYLADKIFPQII